MSHEGKLMRGLKWYSMRDKDQNLPLGVRNTSKIDDVNYYLEFVKGKDVAKVTELLKKLALMARGRQKRFPKYKELLEELNSIGAATKKEKK